MLHLFVSGNAAMVQELDGLAGSAEKNNITFLCNFMLGNTEKCLEILINTDRLPEAAFFARYSRHTL
jgi:coatomer subunit beta'